MKIEILGVKIDNLSLEEALKKAENFLHGDTANMIATPNPEIILRAQEDGEFKSVLTDAALAIPDGFGLVLASKFAKNSLKRKISGTDFFQQLCWICSKNSKSIFLLGGENGVAEKTAENLQKKFPNLIIAGWLDGDIDLENCWQIVESTKPDALFVALGAPKQEKWIHQNMNKINGLKLTMGVGGAFDFVSGKIRRAPVSVQKMGMEWLWRTIIQPHRFRRAFNAVVVFPSVFVFSKVKKIAKI